MYLTAEQAGAIGPSKAQLQVLRHETIRKSIHDLYEQHDDPRPVYFIRAGKRGPVKIGWASDIRGRLRQLACGCPQPLTLLGTMEGGPRMEQLLHGLFAMEHIRGEWFRCSRDLAFWIRRISFPKTGAWAREAWPQ